MCMRIGRKKHGVVLKKRWVGNPNPTCFFQCGLMLTKPAVYCPNIAGFIQFVTPFYSVQFPFYSIFRSLSVQVFFQIMSYVYVSI